MNRRQLTAIGLWAVCSIQYGCVSTTDSGAFLSAVRSYPMGPGQFMVTCVDSPVYCANESNKLCPQGFDVTSNTTNPQDFGRMTMIIRCHKSK